jgi:putative transposase
VLPALIRLESLPVQMHYDDKAENWPGSSAAGHTGLNVLNDALVTDHVDYWQDGNTPFARQAKYRERMAYGLSAGQNTRIEQALFGQWVLGEAAFLAQLESRASRRIAPAARGRPKKAVAVNSGNSENLMT